jgi:hypothetical protein
MPDDNRKVVRSPLPVRIQPEPNLEEAAAIVAALADEGLRDTASLKRSRWRLAGLLRHSLEPGKEPDGSLWAYPRWGG